MPTILVENPQWREDTNVPVEEREDVFLIPESNDPSEVVRAVLEQLVQKSGNRTRYLRVQVDQLTGSSGSIDNLNGVNPANKAPGTFLAYDDQNNEIVYQLPPSGINLLQNGSNILAEELSDDDRNFENGIGSWVNEVGTSLAQSNTLVRSGTQALRIETTATGDVTFTTATGVSGYPITPGTIKIVEGYLRNQSVARAFALAIRFYNIDGDFLNGFSSDDVSANNAQWFRAALEATAPIDTNVDPNQTGVNNPNAVFYALAFTIKGVAATGEFHYVDDISVRGKLGSRQFLDVQGASVTEDPANRSFVIGSLASNYREVTADVTAQSNDNTATYVIDASVGPIQITLPNGLDDEYQLEFKRIDSTANAVTFNVQGTVDPASTTAVLEGKFAGLQVIHTGGNEWLFLPFSGGALGEIRVVPDGTPPSLGTWLQFDGSYHLRANYPDYDAPILPDNSMHWLEPENWEFVPHSTDTPDGQIDPVTSRTSGSNAAQSGFVYHFYNAIDKTFLATSQTINSQYDYDFWVRSTDDGETWANVPFNLPVPTSVNNRYAFVMIGSVLFAWNSQEDTLHRSTDYSDSWTDISAGVNIPDISRGDCFLQPASRQNGTNSFLCGDENGRIGSVARGGRLRR
ncbi:MAG: hypothetical protein AAF267_25325 [Deinococcota bacterium]